MPHSIHLFLEQISLQLWVGCAFVINAIHVVQASATAHGIEQEPYADKYGQFQQAGLATLAFQEYSESFPHEQWTIGFAGRPAGPDWYINLYDNQESHGPGMQEHHALTGDADPCFGKVVEGKEVVMDMTKQETHNGIFVKRVAIKSAIVIPPGEVGQSVAGGAAGGGAGDVGRGGVGVGVGGLDPLRDMMNLPKNYAKDVEDARTGSTAKVEANPKPKPNRRNIY